MIMFFKWLLLMLLFFISILKYCIRINDRDLQRGSFNCLKLIIFYLPFQQFKCMPSPFTGGKAGDTPQHTQRFNGPGSFSGSHIFYIKAKKFADARNLFFCSGIVTADEHAGLYAAKIGVNH